jgi:TPR repeat protein
MTKYIFSLLVGLALTGCATPKAQSESEYNQGVAAYKAKDYAAARDHWSKAAEQGELSAFNNLGYLLHSGLGGAAEQARAVSLWAKGASMGHSEAQWHLGQAYEEGKGVQPSLIEAYAWYRCAIESAEAASSDDQTEALIAKDAHQSLTQLLNRLPAEDLAEAESLAKRRIKEYAKKSAT